MLASKSRYPEEHKCKLCSKTSDENERYGCGCYFCYTCLFEMSEKKVQTYRDKKMCPNQHQIASVVNKILKEKKENEKKIKVLSEKINEKLENFEDTCTNGEDIVKTKLEIMRQEIEICYESAVSKLNEWKEEYKTRLNKYEDECLNNLRQKDKRDAVQKYIQETKADTNTITGDRVRLANVLKLEDIDKALDEKRDGFKHFMYADKTVDFKPPTVEPGPSIIGRLVTEYRTGNHGFDFNTIDYDNFNELHGVCVPAEKMVCLEDKDEYDCDEESEEDEDEDETNKSEDEEKQVDIKILPTCNDKLLVTVDNMGAIYDFNGETNKPTKCGTSLIATQENKIYMLKDSRIFYYSTNFKFHGMTTLLTSKTAEINAISCSDDFVYVTSTCEKLIEGSDNVYDVFITITVFSTEKGLSLVGDITRDVTIGRFIEDKLVEGDYKLKDYDNVPILTGKNGKLYVWYADDHDLDIIDEKTFKLITSVKTPNIESINNNKNMTDSGGKFKKIVVDNEDLIIIRENHVLMFCRIENKELKFLKQIQFYEFIDYCVTNNGRLAILDNNLSIKIY